MKRGYLGPQKFVCDPCYRQKSLVGRGRSTAEFKSSPDRETVRSRIVSLLKSGVKRITAKSIEGFTVKETGKGYARKGRRGKFISLKKWMSRNPGRKAPKVCQVKKKDGSLMESVKVWQRQKRLPRSSLPPLKSELSTSELTVHSGIPPSSSSPSSS